MNSLTTPSNRAQRRAIQREEKKAAKKAAKKAVKLGLPVNVTKPSATLTSVPTKMKKKEAVEDQKQVTHQGSTMDSQPPSLPSSPSTSSSSSSSPSSLSFGHEVPVVIPTENKTAAAPVVIALQEDIIKTFPTILENDHQPVDSTSVINDRPLVIVINEEVIDDQENETGPGETEAHLVPLTYETEVTQTSLHNQEKEESGDYSDDDVDYNEYNNHDNEEADEMISDTTSIASQPSSFLSSPRHNDVSEFFDHAQLSIGQQYSDSDVMGSLDNRGSEQTLVANENESKTKKNKSTKSKRFHKVILTSLRKMKKEKISSPEKSTSNLPPSSSLKKNKPWKFWKKETDSRVTIV